MTTSEKAVRICAHVLAPFAVLAATSAAVRSESTPCKEFPGLTRAANDATRRAEMRPGRASIRVRPLDLATLDAGAFGDWDVAVPFDADATLSPRRR